MRQTIPIADLVLDSKNPRKHGKKDIDATADSLLQFSQQTPIVITADRLVVKGNGTVMAAQVLLERQEAARSRLSSGTATAKDKRLLAQDWSQLWYEQTDLTGEALRAYALADNRTGVLAPFDMANIGDAMKAWRESNQLVDFAIGWSETDISRFVGPVQSKDDPGEKMDRAVELLKKWKVKPGDLYSIEGRQSHRLLCGDCSLNDSLELLMDGRQADLLLTDPPYNVAYAGHVGSERTEISNDDMGEDFGVWLHGVLTVASMHLGKGRSWYVWYANSESHHVFQALVNADMEVRQCLIWKKNSIVMGRQDYHWDHEPCVLGWSSDLGPVQETPVYRVDPAPMNIRGPHPDGYSETFEPCAYGWKFGAAHRWFADRKQKTVLEFDRPSRSEAHPTMKPVELIAYQMRNSTRAGELVLDVFLGSGTTMYAAEISDRQCFGTELEPKYCAVILERMKAAGCKVTKL